MTNYILLANCEHDIVSVTFVPEFPDVIHAVLRLPNGELYLNGEHQWTDNREAVAKEVAMQLLDQEVPALL